MGLSPMRISICRHDPQPAPAPAAARRAAAGNPDPARFDIIDTQTVGAHTVAMIRYPDAANYEGTKVLVYRNTTSAELRAQTTLDPHFCDQLGHLSPFARFEPTADGWAAAIGLAGALDRH